MDDNLLTQDAAIKLVESIGSTLGLERVNDASGVSYYAISQDTAVRISDHSTHLQTWVDKGTYTKKNKYSIVIEVNPSKPVLAVQPDIGTFVVTEFKHKLRGLSDDAVLVLANAIKGAIGTGGQFSNPLHMKPKMLASTQLNESKTNKNMKKNVVKINENTLRKIVAESVKKVLNERFVPNGESEYNDENWNNEQENIMCFDLFAGSSFGLSDNERSEILTATLFDRYDKVVGRLNDFHFKYNADTDRLIGSV